MDFLLGLTGICVITTDDMEWCLNKILNARLFPSIGLDKEKEKMWHTNVMDNDYEDMC